MLVSRKEYNDAMLAYKTEIVKLPPHMMEPFPTFDEFLESHNPHHLTWFHSRYEVYLVADDKAYQIWSTRQLLGK